MLQVPRRQPDETVVRYPRTTAHIQQPELCTILQDPLHEIVADGAREGGDRQLLQLGESRSVHLKRSPNCQFTHPPSINSSPHSPAPVEWPIPE